MPWIKFPDAAYYVSVPVFEAVMAHEGADDFAYYVGGNIALHPWFAQDVRNLRTGSRRGMGIHVHTVVGRDGRADGLYFARWNRDVYGAGDGDDFVDDLEPNVYRANPTEARRYSQGWAPAVREMGLSPVLYSTDDACAALGELYDKAWVAKPGHGDPSTIFAPTFMVDRIAVQWAFDVSWGGVTYDLSTSEFSFIPSGAGRGGTPDAPTQPTQEDDDLMSNPVIAERQDGTKDAFVRLPGGAVVHLYPYDDTLTIDPEHADPVPGSWGYLIAAKWDPTETELRMRGVENQPSGRVYDSIWRDGKFSDPKLVTG